MTQSLNNFANEKNQLFTALQFLKVLLLIISTQTILIGNLVTYSLLVISCENSNFEGHQNDFSDERSNLPKVIYYIERFHQKNILDGQLR